MEQLRSGWRDWRSQLQAMRHDNESLKSVTHASCGQRESGLLPLATPLIPLARHDCSLFACRHYFLNSQLDLFNWAQMQLQSFAEEADRQLHQLQSTVNSQWKTILELRKAKEDKEGQSAEATAVERSSEGGRLHSVAQPLQIHSLVLFLWC